MPSTTGPNSVTPWKRPVAGMHPRWFITNRKRVTIGAITGGSFDHGVTITWNGGASSGKVVENTINGATTLYYEPVSGTPVGSGQVITSGGTTTTTTSAAVDDGLSVAAIQARKNGPMAPEWNLVQSYINAANGPLTKDDTWWDDNRAPEQMASMAFSYLISGNTTHGNAAVTAAVNRANGAVIASGSGQRAHMTAMAMVYDWCYLLMSPGQRDTVRNALAHPTTGPGYIRSRYDPGGDEFVWGAKHGDMCYAFICLCATMEDDPSTANCNTQVFWMNTMATAFDNGTNAGCYWPIFRHFGNVDGGTHKGAGTYGYNVVNLDFYHRVLFVGQSALVTDFYAREPWYGKQFDWVLWHLRPDLNNFSQGDERHLSGQQFHIHSSVHATQVTYRDATIRAQAAQWYLKSWVSQAANQVFWGPYYMFSVIWGRTTGELAATEPTLSNQNGGSPVKHFEAVGKTVFRNGWKKTSVAVAISRPKYFTGDHAHADIGDFQLAAHEEILACKHGHYDPDASNPSQGGTIFQDDINYQVGQSATYQAYGGHRYTYQQSGLSKNTVRVYSDAEDDTPNQIKDSFQKHCGSDSAFGRGHMSGGNFVGTRANYGGPLWPKKNPGSSCQAAPVDLADILATSVWNFATAAHLKPWTLGDNHAYLVVDLKPWYWSGKQTRMKRHFLWIKESTLAGFDQPILMVWDDLNTTVDSNPTKGGKKTQIIQLQTQTTVQSGGTSASMSFAGARGKGKLFVRVLSPAVDHGIVGGLGNQAFSDASGNIYPPTGAQTYDDSSLGAFRSEWNPQVATANPQFLHAYIGTPVTTSVVPTPQLIDEATSFGIRWIFGAQTIEARMTKGDVHGASVTVPTPTDTTPPAIPTPSPPNATAGDGQVVLTWNANSEPDLGGYHVYRSTKVAGVFGSDILVATRATPDYTDTSVTNGTTYRYAITAFDTPAGNESAKTAYTPDQTPAGAAPPDNPPAAPTGLVATAQGANVQLDWNDNGESDLNHYKLYREEFLSGAWQAETLVDGNISPSQKTDNTVVSGHTYRYRVGAVDNASQESPRSAYSNTVIPVTPQGPPSTNNKFRASGMHPSSDSIPAADASGITTRDLRHLCNCYILQPGPPPPPDISIGAPLICTEPVLDGSTILSPAPADGATIISPAPLSGAPITGG